MKPNLYRIDHPPPGRLAVMPRPRGGDWLDDEIKSWVRAGVGVVVSLLTADEQTELELDLEPQACARAGLEFHSFAIPDRGVPTARKPFFELVRQLQSDLQTGKSVAIHCRAGIGRATLLAACIMVATGSTVEDAFVRIRAARGCPVPDTAAQREWVVRFAAESTSTAVDVRTPKSSSTTI